MALLIALAITVPLPYANNFAATRPCAPFTCREIGGIICSADEFCSTNWLDVSDTDRCCSGHCITRGVPGDVEVCVSDGTDFMPIGGANLTLRSLENSTHVKVATTDTNGCTLFHNVPSGIYLLVANELGYSKESLEIIVTPGYTAQEIHLTAFGVRQTLMTTATSTAPLRAAPSLISYALVGLFAGGVFQYVKRRRKLRTLRWDIHLSVLFSLILPTILTTMVVRDDLLSSVQSVVAIGISYLCVAFFDAGLRIVATRIPKFKDR